MMQNSNQVLENKFDHLYFHAKSYVKRKIIKIMCSTSQKRSGHVVSKIGDLEDFLPGYTKFRVKSKKYNQNMFTLEAILIIYTFMQNLRLKAKISQKSRVIHD